MPALIVVIVLIVIAGLIVGGIYAYRRWERLREQECLDKAIKAATLLESQPAEAGRLCQEVCNFLSPRSLRLNPTGLDAYTRALVFLAILDQRTAQLAQSEERLSVVRRLLPDGRVQRRRLLTYYLVTGVRCDEAVQAYVEVCGDGRDRVGADLFDRSIARLREACTLAPGMRPEELSLRVRWNQSAQKLLPKEAWPRLNLGQAYLELKKPDLARQVYDALATKQPALTAARFGRARAYLALGDKDRARQELLVVADAADADAETVLEAARRLTELGAFKDTERILNRLGTARPDLKSRCLAIKGRGALALGQGALVVPALEKAYTDDPADTELAVVLAEAYSQTGKHDVAVRVARDLHQAQPDNLETTYLLAAALFNTGDYAQAGELFDQCLRREHRPRQVRLALGRCRIGERRYREAAAVLAPSEKQGGEDSFYRGVALFRIGDFKQALPAFRRVYDRAKKAGQKDLSRRAGMNCCACFVRIGEEQVRSGSYLQAVKAFETALRGYTGDHPQRGPVLRALSRCYRQEAVRLLRGGGASAATQAIPLVEQSLKHLPDGRSRRLLAALLYHGQRWDDAAGAYRELQREFPAADDVRFGWAVATARTAAREEGLKSLEQIADRGGPYARRAALARAEAAAAENDYRGAVGFLVPVATASGGSADPYHAEVCRQSILYAVKGGFREQAEALAKKLFSANQGAGVELILGCLLAEQGDYPAALPYLERNEASSDAPASWWDTSGEETGAAATQNRARKRLLAQVYLRITHQHCRAGEFPRAVEVLNKAIRNDREQMDLREYLRLAKAASENARMDVDEKLIEMLDKLHDETRTDPLLLRSRTVAHHRRGYELAKDGNHGRARPFLRQAHELWGKHIRARQQFWSQYVAEYNRGKEYQLQMSSDELEKQVVLRLAGLCIAMCDDRLRLLQFNEARDYWRDAVGLAGKDEALRLFKELVNVDAIANTLDPKKNLDKVRSLFQFVYDEIDRNPEYGTLLANLAANEKAMKSQHVLDEGLTRLKAGNAAAFLILLREAADASDEIRGVATQIQRLGTAVLDEIVRQFNRHPLVVALRPAVPAAMIDNVLWNTVIAFAVGAQQIPGGIRVPVVTILMDKVLELVFQAIKK